MLYESHIIGIIDYRNSRFNIFFFKNHDSVLGTFPGRETYYFIEQDIILPINIALLSLNAALRIRMDEIDFFEKSHPDLFRFVMVDYAIRIVDQS